MKKRITRWWRRNHLEAKLLSCSIIIIIGNLIALSYADKFCGQILVILLSLLIEMIVGIRINKHSKYPLADTYFIAYTISFVCLVIANAVYISMLEQANSFLYGISISGALFLYVLGLFLMQFPDKDETPPHYPPKNESFKRRYP